MQTDLAGNDDDIAGFCQIRRDIYFTQGTQRCRGCYGAFYRRNFFQVNEIELLFQNRRRVRMRYEAFAATRFVFVACADFDALG